jgi:hypothetical protein
MATSSDVGDNWPPDSLVSSVSAGQAATWADSCAPMDAGIGIGVPDVGLVSGSAGYSTNAAGFVLRPLPEVAAEELRVDVWFRYYHARMVRPGIADMRFEPPQAA